MSTEQLQAALAGEHAAVYAYGVVGAWTSGGDRDAATAAFDVHRARRDRITALLTDIGEDPVGPAGGYLLPVAVDGPETARALAATVESAASAVYADVVLAADGDADLRTTAARWQVDAAVRAALWSATTVAFPGAPELAAPLPSPSRS
ncbi:MAG: ferritin-like domain-containing protein [Candidatus Nanopelagicales bacterium]